MVSFEEHMAMLQGEDGLLHGWADIARMLGCSVRHIQDYRGELLAAGVISFEPREGGGRPVVRARSSAIREWTAEKAKRGEMI